MIYGAIAAGSGLTWLLLSGIARAAFDRADNAAIVVQMAQSYLPDDHPLKTTTPDPIPDDPETPADNAKVAEDGQDEPDMIRSRIRGQDGTA